MNTANLQLAGLYAVVASLTNALREKGLLSADEIDCAVAQAEDASAADQTKTSNSRMANVDAICFPARYLRIANKAAMEGRQLSFSQLATRVGETKPEYAHTTARAVIAYAVSRSASTAQSLRAPDCSAEGKT